MAGEAGIGAINLLHQRMIEALIIHQSGEHTKRDYICLAAGCRRTWWRRCAEHAGQFETMSESFFKPADKRAGKVADF